MTPDTNRDKKLAKIRTEIENWASEGLIPEVLEGLRKHSYAAHLPAHHFSRGLLGDFCSRTDILLLSGRDTTNSAGIAKLSLNSLLCGVVSEGLSFNEVFVMIREPNFVATPHGALPLFATVVTHSAILQRPNTILFDRDGNGLPDMRALDVTVDISTWNHDGSPASNIYFSWVCTVEVAKERAFG